jgi:hypothetical protein
MSVDRATAEMKAVGRTRLGAGKRYWHLKFLYDGLCKAFVAVERSRTRNAQKRCRFKRKNENVFGKDDMKGKRETLIEGTAGPGLFSAASQYTANYSSPNGNKVAHNTH